MIATQFPDYMPIQWRENGRVLRVGSTRVTLDTVVYAFNQGMIPEEIVLAYSALSLSDVYYVIAYYLEHRDEVNEYIREREKRAEVVKREVEARHPEMAGIRERLLARLEEKRREKF